MAKRRGKARKGKKRSKGKPWYLFGLTWLYVMVHLPCFWFVKIGITGKGADKRAKQVDSAVLGWVVPIFFLPIPFAHSTEQWLHDLCDGISVQFYTGDGCKEWFLLPAAVPAIITACFMFCAFLLFVIGVSGILYYFCVDPQPVIAFLYGQ